LSNSLTEVGTDSMLVFKGTHGTTISAAQDITLHNSFQKTKDGYAGSGVYFWRYNNEYAKDLAVCWYDSRVRKGKFRENEGAVIYVDIRVKEDEFLDLETPFMKDIFGTFAMMQLDENDEIREQKGAMYDLFIEQLEKNTGMKYKVFQIRIPPPKRCHTYSKLLLLLGDPLCYVVRDESCISLEKFEEIKR